ncbi:hypothetical protein HNY73_009086 [Argiope bruennichi]|uniref:Uncharacterized protein n=1 Tax=Argiope bruennichi TaxID=94029 RepID=A0A8T0FB55_ARGBR|nr:hypothetical protein HNY73_009086 [Argiope bruennichi]
MPLNWKTLLPRQASEVDKWGPATPRKDKARSHRLEALLYPVAKMSGSKSFQTKLLSLSIPRVTSGVPWLPVSLCFHSLGSPFFLLLEHGPLNVRFVFLWATITQTLATDVENWKRELLSMGFCEARGMEY